MSVRPIIAAGWAAVLSAVLWLWSPTAHAEMRALLVGVSGYPDLPPRLRLTGPANDAQRMRQVLMARGFRAEHIETLADGVSGAALPTRANVLAALERIALRSGRGDIVLVHFSGHGSQQPAAGESAVSNSGPAQEQIFLPYDVKRWDRDVRSVTNAIKASELRAAADRITARGAFLWAIFDACHSARLVRGAENDSVRYRQVPAAELGVPEPASGPAAARPASDSTATRGQPSEVSVLTPTPDGGAALFYATQTYEMTPEMPLPAGRPDARVMGLFTFVVAKALEQAQVMTYKQLSQHVLAEYRTLGDARATPLFAGAGLDRLVLGQGASQHLQWPLEVTGDALAVGAGELSGLAPGSVLAVLPSAVSGSAEIQGYLTVVTSRRDRAELAPVAHAGRAAPARASLRSGQFVRLVSNPVEFDLRIAVDPNSCPARCVLVDAAARLQREGVPGVAAVWVELSAAPDIVLEQIGERVVFVPATARADALRARSELAGAYVIEGGKPLASAAAAGRVAAGLHAVARTRNLMRVAAKLVARGTGAGLSATLKAERGKSGRPEAIPAGMSPQLRSGDVLLLTLRNEGPTALDVTVLYLDADQGIVCLYPSRAGETNRLDPKGEAMVDIDIKAPPVGAEHLLIIAAEVTRLGEQRNYAFLEQPPLDRRRSSGTDPEDAFADAVFADYRARGATRPAPPPAQTTVQLFAVTVRP